MKFETKCLHAGYSPKNGEPRVQPIVQSTTYTYDSAEEIGKLFDLQAAGYFYTRLANPTTNAAEEKITALEGGVATMCTASGQSAVFYAMLNILEAGDHFIFLCVWRYLQFICPYIQKNGYRSDFCGSRFTA